MLTGTVIPIDKNEFQYRVSGGFYGQGRNLGNVFILKRP